MRLSDARVRFRETKLLPRNRSNRWLADQLVVVRMLADPKPEHAAFNVFAEYPILLSHSR